MKYEDKSAYNFVSEEDCTLSTPGHEACTLAFSFSSLSSSLLNSQAPPIQ